MIDPKGDWVLATLSAVSSRFSGSMHIQLCSALIARYCRVSLILNTERDVQALLLKHQSPTRWWSDMHCMNAGKGASMSTIHQRQTGAAAHSEVPQEGPCASSHVAFSVEPSSAHEREAQEIHDTLQQCQGMIGAHEITSWRSQLTVSVPVLQPTIYRSAFCYALRADVSAAKIGVDRAFELHRLASNNMQLNVATCPLTSDVICRSVP